jgi:REP element-mobilizing transposase RayT
LRKHLGEVFRKLAQQKECRIEEGHPWPDHVHLCAKPSQNQYCEGAWTSDGCRARTPSFSGLQCRA